MSRWAFRFLLFYILVLFTQPQNRFPIMHPWRIANLSALIAMGLHIGACAKEGRPLIRLGPGTIVALIFVAMSLLSLHAGKYQPHAGWNSFIDLMMKNALVLVLIEAMAYNVKRAWAVMGCIMMATLWWIKAGLRLGAAGATYASGRIMGPAVSMVENPNGFAYLMCVTLPVYLYFYQRAQTKIEKWGFLALFVSGVYIIFNTGSRTGLLALIACGAFVLPRYFAKHKTALLTGTACVLVIWSGVDPRNLERFRTIGDSIREYFTADELVHKPVEAMNQDEQSAFERRMKNRDTWLLIQDNLFFGVGIAPAEAFFAERYPFATGQVHNEILMAGKQMGLVGMSLYLAFLGIIGLGGWSIQRSTESWWPDVSNLGWTLKVQSIIILVGGFFSPIPWNPYTLILVGTSSAVLINLQQMEQARIQAPSLVDA